MIVYLAFAALVLLPALLPWNAWPPLREGRAWNGIGHIAMPDRATTYPGYWPCVHAQEIAEWWTAWAGALVIGLPVAWLLSGTVVELASPLAAIIAWRWRMTRVGERFVEYIGWNVEILTGRKMGLTRYASDTKTAGDLWTGYPHLFTAAGLTSLDALNGLRRWRWLARIVAALLHFRIRKGIGE